MKILLRGVLFLLLSNIFFTNCTSEEANKEQTLSELKARYTSEVMDVHDEIMPLTMKIPPLQEDLEAIKTAQPETSSAIDEAIDNLQKAYDAMYQWMDEAGAVQSELYKMKTEAANERLEVEKEVILEVQKMTEQSIEQAQALKEKLSQ